MNTHETYMERAIAFAEKARPHAPPNPWVGCVIVNNGRIVGEGYTSLPGGHHAEIHALNQAGNRAKGSTVYCTLEPCSHHGRTAPCVEALIKAQVSHVVIGIEDPDHHVRGQGILRLKEAGIGVTIGVASEKISRALAPYLYHRKTGRPYCIAKVAASLDGRIAAKDGSSQWITSSKARADAHQLRADSQALVIGSGTALADTPLLTVRDAHKPPRQQPLRVILDTFGKVIPPSPLLNTALAPTLMVTTDQCPENIQRMWSDAGAAIHEAPLSKKGKGIDLDNLMALLGKKGILQVMVEGGASLLGNFILEGRVDLLVVYIGPRIIGETGMPLFRLSYPTIDDAPYLSLLQARQIDDCMRLEFKTTKTLEIL